MFLCNHNGQCCEDPKTQISLTLGDIQRICSYTKKNSLQLYQQGIIGVYPFGDYNNSDIFEMDIGLFIPCKFREIEEKTNHKSCSIYDARPLNCRMFPFWILAEAPIDKVMEFADNHQCGKCCGIDNQFSKDREKYKKFKDKIAEILLKEAEISDKFYEGIGIKKYIRANKSSKDQDDLITIKMLVSDLQKQDFSNEFKEIDKEIKKQKFIKSKSIPSWEEFK